MNLIRFLHMLGIGLWLGGGAVAVLVNTLEAKTSPTARAAVDEMLGKVYAWVVGPGAITAVAAGVALTMMAASQGYGARLGHPPIAAMQGIGLVAATIEIFVSLPTSQRLARISALSEGAESSATARLYRRRLRAASGTALVLVAIALYFGVVG